MTKKKILLAWELGTGLGHVTRLAGIARQLAEAGQRPVLALQQPESLALVAPHASWEVWTAPQAKTAGADARPFRAASYADILARLGFAEPDSLHQQVQAWDLLLENVRPDVVVTDHSPTLMLAARGRVPVVVVGTGFSVPPTSGSSFPTFDRSAEPIGSQDQLWESIVSVQRRRGAAVPPSLPLAFAGDRRFVMVPPELDCYPGLRTDPYAPVDSLDVPLSAPRNKQFFAYLHGSFPGLDVLFTGLGAAGLRGAAYIPHASTVLAQQIRAAGHVLYDHPPALHDAIDKSAVVLHHGGAGTAQAGLLAGRPQIVLPQYSEQELIGLALQLHGVGVSLAGWISAERVVEAVHLALEAPSLTQQAESLAQLIRARGPGQGDRRVARACQELLPQRSRGKFETRSNQRVAASEAASVAHIPVPFIVGVPRSGTTLLRLMLDSHPDLVIPTETFFLPAAVQASLCSRDSAKAFVAAMSSHPRWPDQHLDAAELLHAIEASECLATDGRLDVGEAIRVFYRLHARRANKPRWGDKTPTYNGHLRLLQGLLPEARFIHMLRDGRDVYLSMRAFWWGQKSAAEAAVWWAEQILETRQQAQSVPHYLEVRYEDLVSEPERVLREIGDFLQLPWDERMLAYPQRAAERMAEVVTDVTTPTGDVIPAEQRRQLHRLVWEPPRPARIARWKREMSAADRAAFREHAGERLKECGYES